MAPDNQLLAAATIKMTGDGVGDDFEVLECLIHYAALGVAGVVSAIAVTAAATCQFIDEVQLFDDGAVGGFKHPRLGAIDQGNACMLHAVEDGGQRFQMESLIQDDVALGQFGGQFELAPISIGHARKDSLAFAPVAAQRIRHFQDALQVRPCGLVLTSFLLRLAERAIDQVFDEDGLVTMRPVRWRRGLIVERYCAALRRMEISQFSDVISCDHSASPAWLVCENQLADESVTSSGYTPPLGL